MPSHGRGAERLTRSGGWAACVTAPGPGAVALFHVGGEEGFRAVARLFVADRGLPPPGGLRHGWLRDLRGEVLDEALLVHIPAGASYLGEPFLELGVHGGAAVVRAVAAALAAAGLELLPAATLADRAPVEPLRRAAWRALRRARSRRAVAALAAVLAGALAERLAAAAGDPQALAALHAASRRLRSRLRTLRAVFLGPPNAGKSSLVNALARKPVAVVSPEPGTTRDPVTVDLLLADYPVQLVDTEGGVPAVRRGALQVWVADATVGKASAPVGAAVRVWNKTDHPRAQPAPPGWLPVSARTGAGCEELIQALLRAGRREPVEPEPEGLPAYWTRRDLELLALATRGDAGAWGELRARTLPRGPAAVG